MKDPKILTKYKYSVGNAFNKSLAKYNSEEFYKPITEYLIVKNQKQMPKRIRSSIFLEIINGLSLNENDYLKFACAIEFLHEFSLVHDDIQDKDEIRRGNLSLWKKFGTEKSIIMGNIIKSISDIITSNDDTTIDPGTSKKVIETLNEVCINIIEGQYLDILYECKPNLNLEKYTNMISKKTGALLSLSFYLPAILSKKTTRQIELLKRLGNIFGILFQISDDILGIWGDPENTGKSNSSDIQNNKKTYPIILINEKFSAEDKSKLKKLNNEKSIDELHNLLDLYNIKKTIKRDCEKYISISKDIISQIDLKTNSKENLDELFTYVMERVK